jgi:hypothetical protein
MAGTPVSSRDATSVQLGKQTMVLDDGDTSNLVVASVVDFDPYDLVCPVHVSRLAHRRTKENPRP